MKELETDMVNLLQELVRCPSVSREEAGTADIIEQFLTAAGCPVSRNNNNVWTTNRSAENHLPTILLNSHHDTVPATSRYSRDPFDGLIEGERLYGLGSNDASGSVVALLGAYLQTYSELSDSINIVLLLSAEEEVSGANGVESVLPLIGNIDFGVVGEPTSLKAAVAEKGLLVVDCVSTGKSGHAARGEGENAIYKALKDIDWIQSYEFSAVSETLGPPVMSVNVIESGTAHNVTPDDCHFVVDIRTTDAISNRKALSLLRTHLDSSVEPRSLRLAPSGLPANHPILDILKDEGIETYGSPTLSDQALMNFPTIKIGPGDSSRSHTADEWIAVEEIYNAIRLYERIIRAISRDSSGFSAK